MTEHGKIGPPHEDGPKAEEMLKACAHCEGKELKIVVTEHLTKQHLYSARVHCRCTARGPESGLYVTRELAETGATIKWNRRTPAKDEGEILQKIHKVLALAKANKTHCGTCYTVRELLELNPTAPADEGEDEEGICKHSPCPDHRYGGCYTCPGVLEGEIHPPELPDGTSPEELIPTLQAALAEMKEKELGAAHGAWEESQKRIEELEAKAVAQHCEIEAQIQCREDAEAKLGVARKIIRATCRGVGECSHVGEYPDCVRPLSGCARARFLAAISAHDKGKGEPEG